jgi:metal-responsive CopG/Arc/MetJ family transcriptional regulator
MRRPSVSLPDELVELIDENRSKTGALNRSEFMRKATVHYLDSETDIDVEQETDQDIRV